METGAAGKIVRKAVGSVFFLGYLPAPGSVASAAAVTALWFAHENGALSGGPRDAGVYWIVVLSAIACSFFFSNRSRELFGREDARQIVIDEVAGQLVTFLFVPLTVRTLIAGFILFRFFDIVKPFPAYRLEELEDGVGVTMDDVAAGVLANISLLALLFVYHAVKSYL